MTDNRNEKQQARYIAEELDIRYALALELYRKAKRDFPKGTGIVIRRRCRELLLERERNA